MRWWRRDPDDEAVIDAFIAAVADRPETFRMGEHGYVLIDTVTKREYWVASGRNYIRLWKPTRNELGRRGKKLFWRAFREWQRAEMAARDSRQPPRPELGNPVDNLRRQLERGRDR